MCWTPLCASKQYNVNNETTGGEDEPNIVFYAEIVMDI